MKKLARSRLTDKHCWNCTTLLVSGPFRYIDGSMHYCLVCPPKEEIKQTDEGILFYRLLSNKVK